MRKHWIFYVLILALILGMAGFLNAASYYSRLGTPCVLNSTQAQILVWNARAAGEANTTRVRLINVANSNEENATSFKLWLVPGNTTTPLGNRTVSDEDCLLSWTTVAANGTLQIDYQPPGVILSSINGTLQGQAADGPGNLTLMFFGVRE